MRYMKVWAVVALWAVAAGFALAQTEYEPGKFVKETPSYGERAWGEAIEDGVVVGHGDGTYRPREWARRQDAAAMADRSATRERAEHERSWHTPAQAWDGDIAPAEPAKKEVAQMEATTMVAQGVTAGQMVGVFVALGFIGVLIWIAVVLGQRGNVVQIATVANQAAQQANGPVRVSGTDGAGGSYALRIDSVPGQPATVTANATAQGGGGTPTPPPPPVTPPPAPTPSPAAIAAAQAGLQRANWTNITQCALDWVATCIEAAGVVNNPVAIDAIIDAEQKAGNI